jgi:mannitol/fructose-specific phosphotransferase system IIA component
MARKWLPANYLENGFDAALLERDELRAARQVGLVLAVPEPLHLLQDARADLKHTHRSIMLLPVSPHQHQQLLSSGHVMPS